MITKSILSFSIQIGLIVGFSAIIFSLILGVGLGLTAGYFGGKYEMIVMRLTDVQLTVPSILMALLVDGIARGLISREMSSISTLEVAWEHKSLWPSYWDETNFCSRVAETNKLELLKWMREEKKCKWDEWTTSRAAEQGNLEMVKYCANTFPNNVVCEKILKNPRLSYITLEKSEENVVKL